MKGDEARAESALRSEDESLGEILHALSQPLTTLECGLELALRYDKTLAQVRHRLKVLLEAAQVMHQKLLAMRDLAAVADGESYIGSDKSSNQ